MRIIGFTMVACDKIGFYELRWIDQIIYFVIVVLYMGRGESWDNYTKYVIPMFDKVLN